MKKIYALVFSVFLWNVLLQSFAQQVNTTGTDVAVGLAPSYATLAAAITDLNSKGTVPGNVVITLEGDQVAPAGGYVITASGTAAFSILLEGAGYTVTAGLQAAGSTNDAVFKVVGGDYIIIQDFIITENASNTISNITATANAASSGLNVNVASTAGLTVGMAVFVSAGTGQFAAGSRITSINSGTQFSVSIAPTTALASGATILAQPLSTNVMTEFGIALYAASTSNGAQNNIIQGNNIALNSTYWQSTGIMSSSTFVSTTTAAGAAPATQTAVAGGENSNNQYLSNTIGSVNYGILLVAAPATATVKETGNDIGGAFDFTGNTITYGNNAPMAVLYNLVPTSANTDKLGGIIVTNSTSVNVSYNIISSSLFFSNIGTSGITLNGTAPSGFNFTNTVNNNTITVKASAAAGTAPANGIDFGYGLNAGGFSSTLIANNNTITINQTTAAATTTAAITAIKANYASGSTTAGSNLIVINQTHAFASTVSSALTGIWASGFAIGTAAFSSNNITFNQVHQTTTATSVTSSVNGILMGAAAVTVTTANLLSNTITVKQSVASSGTFGLGTINYINVSGAAAGTQTTYATLNINSNNLNTLGSTIRYVGGTANVIGVNHDFTNVTSLTISTDTMDVDRSGVGGPTYGTYTGITSTYNAAAVNPTSSVTNNRIFISGTMTGGVAIVGLSELEGNNTITKNITGNTVNINLPNTTSGTHTGAQFQTGSTVAIGTSIGSVANNNITIATGGQTVSGVQVLGGLGLGIITNINNNTFNLSSTGNSNTLIVRGVNVNGSNRSKVFNNTFASLAATGITTSTTPRLTAIELNFGTADSVYNNTISNAFTFAGTGGATVEGVFVNGISADIYKNKIYGLTASTTGGATNVNGIRLIAPTGGSNNVFNNIIGFDNSASPNASSADAVRGIFASGTNTTSTYNLAFNTIYLAAVPSAAVTNFGTSGITHVGNATASSGRLNLVNNIIVNKSTPKGSGLTVALRRSVSLVNYGDGTAAGTNNCNNNLFYAGIPGASNLIYYDVTNSNQTINAFKILAGGFRDFNSISEDPVFASTAGASATFLHFTAGTATLVEGGAKLWTAPPTISDDFDANTRCPGGGCPGGAASPDIGADEFAGTCIPPTVLPTGYSVGAYGASVAGNYRVTFTGASPAPTGGYLVVRTVNPSLQPSPTPGFPYSVGNGIGVGTVVAVLTGAGPSFQFDDPIASGSYSYWLFAYNACNGSPSYSTTALVFSTDVSGCVAPTSQPTAMVVNPVSTTSISGSFTPVGGGGASGYLVIRTSSNAAPVPAPASGTTYTSSGTGTLVSAGTGTIFTATGLGSNTQYWFWVYAYNDLCYTPLPAYNTTSPLTGTATTFPCVQPLNTVNTVGPTATYPTITAAIANLVSCSPLNGANYVFELQSNYVSTAETFPITLPATITGTYTSIIFRPASGATGLNITSSNTSGTLLFQGGSRISFDGRQAGTGSSQLSIQNTNLGSSYAIQFENGSSTDSIRFCNVRSLHNGTSGGGGTINFAQASANSLTGGSGAGTTITVASTAGLTVGSTVTVTAGSGVFAANTTVIAVLSITQFTVSSAPTTALSGATISATGGNSNIVIENNSIFEATGGTTPTTAIYSNGSATSPNNGVKISNNSIYNFFNAAYTTAGINLAANSNTWTINGNSFYKTVALPFTSTTANFNAILSSSTTNAGLTIQDNFIGGTAASAGGAAMTITGNGIMRAIQLTTGTVASSVQNNTIRNISYTSSNSSSLHSLLSLVGGVINVGTVSGNALGNTTGTGSIAVSLSDNTAGVGFAAISGQSVTAADVFTIRNNSIGSIAVSGTSAVASVQGISLTGAGTYTVTGNTIGSAATANSFINNLNSTITGIVGNCSSNAIALTAGSGGGTTITVSSTAGLVLGSTVSVTAGTGAFAFNTTVLTIISATQFTVSIAPTTALSAATISAIPTQTISNNIIANIAAANTGASSYANGIYVGNTGIYNVGDIANGGNSIYNLSSAGTNALNYSATGIASFTSTAGQSIQGNTIYNIAATSGGGNVGVIGIYYASTATGTNNVERNLIHSLNLFSGSTSSIITGIQIDGSGTTNVQNNMIRLGITSTGANIVNAYATYGITENAGANKVYMNSVYIGGSGVGDGSDSYAYYGANTGPKDVRNNIFWNARSNSISFTPNHYAIALLNSTGSTVNYNDLLVTGKGKTLGFFSSSQYFTLATWRAASSGDLNSYSSLPQYVNPTAATPDLHINAAVATVVEGGGTAVGPNNDYDSQTRASLTPVDLGADALNAVASTKIDVGIIDMTVPATGFACYTGLQNVTVTLRNYSGSSINFGTTPVTLTVNVTGAVTTTLTVTINSGSLAASPATASYVVSPSLSMVTTGIYNFSCISSVAGSIVDADITNDEYLTTRTVSNLSIGVASSTPEGYCGIPSGTPTISLNSAGGGTIQWHESTDNITYSNVGTNSLSYSPGSISSTHYYYATVTCGATTLTSNVVIVAFSNPLLLSSGVSPASSCGPSSFSFTGSVNAGATLKWYDAPVNGNLLGTGSPFVSPVLNRTTTYYAKAVSTTAIPTVITLGTGTSTNTTTGYAAPYTNWYGGTKHQMLILADELTAQGVVAGPISSVAFNVASVGTTFTGVLQSFQIDMAATSVTALTSTFEPSGSTVYGPLDQAIPSSGWVTHAITPFFWDGTSNIVIQTSYSNQNVGGVQDHVLMPYTPTAFNSVNYYRADGQTPANILGQLSGTPFANPATPNANRPNLRLGCIASTCTSAAAAVTATVNPVPTPITITPSAPSICPGTPGSDSVQLVATGGTISPKNSVTFTATPNVSIPDVNATGVASTINVTGIPAGSVVDSVRVSVNVNMSWISDIMLTLQGPAATNNVVNLVSNRGGSSDNFTNTIISSNTANASFGTGTAPFTGIFTADTVNSCCGTGAGIFEINPSVPVTTRRFTDLYSGTIGNGNWILRAYDDEAALVGTLNNWSITVYYTEPPIPSTYLWTPAAGLWANAGLSSAYTNQNTTTVFAKPGSTNTYTITATAGVCTSTQTVAVTVNSLSAAATALAASPTTSCSGGNVTLTQTGGTLGTGASWKWYTDPGFTLLAGTSVAANASLVVTPLANTTYYLRAEGGTAPCSGNVPSAASVAVTINPVGTWLGVDNNWNNTANWCGASVPTSATNVIIPTSANYPIITTVTGTAFANNVTIAAGASITTTGTGTLDIKGSFTNNGNLLNWGEVKLTGTSAQTFPGTTGTIGAMARLTVNNTSGVNPAVTIDRNLLIRDAITPTQGIVNLNNVYITLRSVIDSTARVGVVGSSFSYTGTGNFVVERFFPGRRAWRLITAPVVKTASKSIFNSWQAGANNGITGNATYVTGPLANPVTNGLDVSPANNYSLKKFNHVTSGFDGIANTRTTGIPAFPAGNSATYNVDTSGYFIFVRGDRTPANPVPFDPYTIGNSTVLRDTGNVKTGSFTYNCNPGSAPNFYTLIGNPYASPVDFTTLTRNNVANKFTVWDPNLGTVGAYAVWNAGVVTPGGSVQTGIIQSKQAFVVEATGAAPTLAFAEAGKSAVNNSLLFRPAPLPSASLNVNLYFEKADGSRQLADGALAQFNDDYSAGADHLDAAKFTNVNESFSIKDGQNYFIQDRRPFLDYSDTLFFSFTRTRQFKYSFDITVDHIVKQQNRVAYLGDRYMNTATPLNMQGSTTANFEVNSNAASSVANRFFITFRKALDFRNIKADALYSDVEVNWAVINAAVIDHYEVERSSDGKTFAKVGEVAAKENRDLLNDYDFTDPNLEAGFYYYRIKAVSTDINAFDYSDVVKVKVVKSKGSLYVYPNPVTDGIIRLRMQAVSQEGKYGIRLINSAGQAVMLKQFMHTKSVATELINYPSYIAGGAYRLEVTGPDKKLTTVQIVVQSN